MSAERCCPRTSKSPPEIAAGGVTDSMTGRELVLLRLALILDRLYFFRGLGAYFRSTVPWIWELRPN